MHSEIYCPGTYGFCSCPSNISNAGFSLDAKVENKSLYRVSSKVKGRQFAINLLSLSPFGINAIIPHFTEIGNSLFL